MDFVTDRTEADVVNRNSKGIYGPDDLNRVESAVDELIALAPKLDIYLNLKTKTDWGMPGVFPAGFPTRSEMDRYLSNVRAVRDAFGLSASLPSTMRRLTYTGANNIERVLALAFQKAERIIKNNIYCGEIFAGEE